MSIAATSWVWAQKNVSPSTKYVLLAIADNINRKGEAWPTLATIAEKCGITERSVQRQIAAAINRGLVEVTYRASKPSVYNFPDPDADVTLTNVVTPTPASPNPDASVTPYPYLLNRKGTVKIESNAHEEIIESPKLIPDDFPEWFETLLGVQVSNAQQPVIAEHFPKLKKWAEKRGFEDTILEAAAIYVDSSWSKRSTKKIKVYSTFQNSAMKQHEWSEGKNGADGKYGGHSRANREGRAGGFADPDRYRD